MTSNKHLFLILLLLFVIINCTKTNNTTLKNQSTIFLKWNKNHTKDNIQNQIIALKWALSLLGAKNTEVLSEKNIIEKKSKIVLDITSVGFNSLAEVKLFQLINKIKNTEAYKKNASLDLGRFIALTVGSSNHYFKITDIPKTFSQFQKRYTFDSIEGYVNNSGVSKIHRRIAFPKSEIINKQAYISYEIDSITKEIYEYETVDIMDNGQPRFGIYDEFGNLKEAASPTYSNAGKPAKCIWCHESLIQPLFTKQYDFKGYLSAKNLNDTLTHFRAKLKTYQDKHWKDENLLKRNNHTLFEICYISFMHPSTERLSIEWNMPISEIKKKLQHLDTHIYDEFPFLGNLYHRDAVDAFAPYKTLKVSKNFREYSKNEVNYMK